MNQPSGLRIQSQVIDPPLLLAPMMDVTNQAFRAVVRQFGKCGLFYTEMLNARRIPTESSASPFWKGLGVEKDVMIQLLGDDPLALVRSIERLSEFDPFGFDWNLGCARKKITSLGWGSEILEKPAVLGKILAAMRQATRRPLTVKIRIPLSDTDGSRLKKILVVLEGEGADAVAVHARTAGDGFKRKARWEMIAQAKSWTRLPVIGNGDVFSVEDALAMFAQTKCDGVMLGRGAVARPFLFRDIAACLAGKPMLPQPRPEEVLESMLACLGEALETPKGAREFKTFCRYFAEALPVPHWFWARLQSLHDGPEMAKRARAFFKPHE